MRCKWNFWLPIGMMIVFAITCWPAIMPESFKNFSAAYAIAFCAGLFFPGKMRWILPLTTLLVLDVCMNFFYYQVQAVSPYTLFKLGAYACLIGLGAKIGPKKSWLAMVSGGIFGALIFYVITNIASWLFDPGYPKTLSGLLQALTVGLPGYPPTWLFLKNTLISGGLFTGLFAGVIKMSESAQEAEETEEEPGEEPLPEEA